MFQGTDCGHPGEEALDGALIRGAENLGKSFIEKHENLRIQV